MFACRCSGASFGAYGSEYSVLSPQLICSDLFGPHLGWRRSINLLEVHYLHICWPHWLWAKCPRPSCSSEYTLVSSRHLGSHGGASLTKPFYPWLLPQETLFRDPDGEGYIPPPSAFITSPLAVYSFQGVQSSARCSSVFDAYPSYLDPLRTPVV